VRNTASIAASIFAVAAPASRRSTVAAAGTWGVLRNMLQEFPGFKWAGADRGVVAAHGDATMPSDTDAFGCAADGKLDLYPATSKDALSYTSDTISLHLHCIIKVTCVE
jgi:hypothetical protein